MSAYQELLTYTRQLERRVANQERQESGGYTKSEANALFVTYAYAVDNYIDIGAYADFVNVDGGTTGAILHTQIFDHGIEARDGVWGGGGANDDLILEGTSHATKTSSYVILQPTSGNVGIGTSAPSTKLHIAGAGISAHTTEATSWAATTNASSKLDLTTDAANVGMAMRVAKGTERYTTNATTVGFLQYGSSVDQFELVHGTNTRITVSSTGNVGVGVAPAEKLDVNGNILIPNNNFYKAKNSSGTAIQLLGIDASNHVYMGAVGNAGGNVYIREDGSNVITISGANVGIGTAPSAKLHVYGSSPSVWVQDSGAAGAIAVIQATNTLVSIGASYTTSAVDLAIVSGGSEKIRVQTGGNVGIGTTTPGERLTVAGQLAVGNGVPQDVYTKYQTDSRSWWTGVGAVGGDDKFVMYDSTAAAIRMTVDTGGNVGIGTTAPGAKLEVYGSSQSIWLRDSGAAGAVAVIQATNTLVSIGASYFTSAVPLAILSGGAEKVRITTGGDVGIGTASPAQKLDVAGTGKFGDYCLIGTSVSGGYYQDSANGAYRAITSSGTNGYYFQSNGGGSTSMYVGLHGTYAGRVGIGTLYPDARMEVLVNSGEAINVIEVTQEDVNRAFMNFVSTDVASSGTHLVNTAAVGTYYGKIKIAVNGTYRYIPVYNS